MDLALQAILSIAVVMDYRNGRIKNWLTAAGIAAGCILRLSTGETSVLLLLAGIFFPLLCCGLLFRMHALGAGDIKLFSVIGSFADFQELLSCICFSFVAGAIISLLKLIVNRNLMSSVYCFFQYIRQIYATGTIEKYPGRDDGKRQMHFSAAILIGFLVTKGVEYGEIVVRII